VGNGAISIGNASIDWFTICPFGPEFVSWCAD